jgi:hypothetical protein
MRKSSAAIAANIGADQARTDRRSALLQFFADPPRNVVEAAFAMAASDERYGDDTATELADIDAGVHPLQVPKVRSAAG